MISMQQLEELENRVVKALQLISDLRTENSKLENENEEIKGELEETKLSLEEKEQEIDKIRKELDHATIELEELNAKEEVLEKKVIALLGKLDGLSAGGGIPTGDRIERKTPSAASSGFRAKQKPVNFDEDEVNLDGFTDEEVMVETVDSKDTADIDEDEDIIIIDDEGDLSSKSGGGIALETVPDTDDDIILLEEKDEEIIIDDVDSDAIIIDEGEKPGKTSRRQKGKTKDKDDEFLIIEDDK